MKTENWFVYTASICHNVEYLIASNLTQIEAQDLCDEYNRTLEYDGSSLYASYEEVSEESAIAVRLGLV